MTIVFSSVRRSIESGRPRAPPALRAGVPSEREVRLPVVGAVVHVDPSGPDGLRETEPSAEIAGEDRGEQPVRRPVDDLQSLFLAPDRGHGHDRAERLLAGDLHVGVDTVEHRRLEEQVAPVLGRPRHRPRCLRLARSPRDVPLGLGRGRLVVDRPMVVASSNGSPSVIASAMAAELRQVLLPHALVHEEALARGAALPAFRNDATRVASTALSRSASSQITSRTVAPISSSRPLPAAAGSRCPVAIEPMNPTVCVPGFAVIPTGPDR